MAGRYLLIEFDDATQADTLRAQIDNATRKGKRFRVIGMFARPGPKFCKCETWVTERGKVSTLKSGAKFGWMVCTTCRLPAPVMGYLRNLIRPHDIIDPPKYDTKHKVGFVANGLTLTSLSNFNYEEK